MRKRYWIGFWKTNISFWNLAEQLDMVFVPLMVTGNMRFSEPRAH